MKISCPRCTYEPRPHDRWRCRPGCGHTWHTFATHGICPGCGKMWHDTNCPRCRLWSPHDDWYHDDSAIDQPEIREVREKEPA